MCGRYSLTTPIDGIRRLFGFDRIPNVPPRYNIAPTQAVMVVRAATARQDFEKGQPPAPGVARDVAFVRWGLIPSWAKDPSIGSKMINARAETVAEKPAFRTAFRRRRCLVPADSFYEWKKTGTGKQPVRIHFDDGGPFAFAGLWEDWTGADGSQVETCTIVTTDAAPDIEGIHHRMPVILDSVDFETWMTGTQDAAARLMRPYRGPRRLRAEEISTLVNNVRNDGPELWSPPAPGEEGRSEKSTDARSADPGGKKDVEKDPGNGGGQLSLF